MAMVLARQKAISELPSWAICCEEVRKIYLEQGEMVMEVGTAAYPADVECRYCHSVTKKVMYVDATTPHQIPIPVECFDFDEGLAHAK